MNQINDKLYQANAGIMKEKSLGMQTIDYKANIDLQQNGPELKQIRKIKIRNQKKVQSIDFQQNQIQTKPIQEEKIKKNQTLRLQNMESYIDSQIKNNLDCFKIDFNKSLKISKPNQASKIQQIQPKIDQLQTLEIKENIINNADVKPKQSKKSMLLNNSLSWKNQKVEEVQKEDPLIKYNRELQQKLDYKLKELDQLNDDKRALSMQLNSQIKRVRGLQSELGKVERGQICEIVDTKMEYEFRKEKEMNIQLKDRLMLCEQEKIEIQMQISQINKKKDTLVVDSDGNTLNKSSMTTNQMLQYRQQVIKDLEASIKDLDKNYQDFNTNEKDIKQIQDNIQKLINEKNLLVYKVQKLTDQNNQGLNLVEDLKFSMNKQNNAQNNQIACKIYNRQLKRLLKIRKTQIFQNIKNRLQSDENKIQSILAIRKILKIYRYQRQKKYFNLWYQKGLRPHRKVKFNRKVQQYYNKNLHMIQYFRFWKLQKLKQQIQRIETKQTIQQAIWNIRKLEIRKLKYNFERWKQQTQNIRFGGSKLSIFVREQVLYKCRQAFLKWSNLIHTQDFAMRVKCIANKSASKQFISSVFQEWRAQTFQLKLIKFSLLNRTFKYLKKNYHFNQDFKFKTQLILKLNKTSNFKVLQKCFKSLQIVLKVENLEQAANSKNDNINQIKELSSAVLTLQRNFKFNEMTKFKKKLIEQLGGQQYFFFQKWKKYVEFYNQVIFQKFKPKFYLMLRKLFRNSFDLWNEFVLKKRQHKKLKLAQEQIEQARVISDEIHFIKVKEKAENVQRVRWGKKKFNEKQRQLFRKFMGRGFQKWQAAIKLNHKKKDQIYFQIVKLERRFKKLAFNIYRQFTIQKRKQDHQEMLDHHYKQSLKFKKLKRMFSSIQIFKTNFSIAKKKLKLCFQKINKLKFTKRFKFWVNLIEQKFKIDFDSKEQYHQNQLQNNQKKAENLQSLLMIKAQKTNQVEDQKKNFGFKQIVNIIPKLFKHKLYNYFCKWKQQKDAIINKSNILSFSIFQRLKLKITHKVFSIWRSCQHSQSFSKQLTLVEQSKEQQSQLLNMDSLQTQQKKEIEVFYIQQEIKTIHQEQSYQKSKISNVISKISKFETQFVQVRKIKLMFDQWKKFMYDRQLVMIRIAKLINKNLLQKGMDQIKRREQFSRLREKQFIKIQKLIKIFYYRRKLESMMMWKKNIQEQVVLIKDKVSKVLLNVTVKGEYKSGVKKQKLVEYEYHYYYKKLQKIVIEWLKSLLVKKRIKDKKNKKLELFCIYKRIKYSLKLWKLRSTSSIYYKHKQTLVLQSKRSLCLRLCFKSWKIQHERKSVIIQNLVNMDNISNRENLRFAYRAVDWLHKINKFKRKCDHNSAGELIYKLMSQKADKWKLKYFDNWKNNLKDFQKNRIIIHSIFQRRFDIQFRSYFQKWVDFTKEEKSIQFQEDYGHVRIQMLEEEKNIFNLKQFLMQTAGYKEKEIEKILVEDKISKLKMIEKSVCRMKIYQEGTQKRSNNYLLPWCIDKWKQFIKEKKLYRYWLAFVEKKRGEFKLNLKNSFERWRFDIDIKKQELIKKTYQDLQNICMTNQNEKLKLSEKLELKQNQIEEFQKQRDFLLGRMISAQKTALDYCHQNMIKAKRKAFTFMKVHMIIQKRLQHKRDMKAAFDRSVYLTQRMQELEQSNMDLSIHNQSLKENALKVVEILSVANNLQNEIEILHQDIAKKNKQLLQLQTNQ